MEGTRINDKPTLSGNTLSDTVVENEQNGRWLQP